MIEQVLMRSVKTAGGLTRGRGMGESQRSQWLLSMPACADMNQAIQELTGVDIRPQKCTVYGLNLVEMKSPAGTAPVNRRQRAATASISGSRKALLHEINDVNTEASKMGATCGKKCNSDRKQQRKEIALIRFVQRLRNIINKNRVVPFSEQGSRSASSVISKTTVITQDDNNKEQTSLHGRKNVTKGIEQALYRS
ncbi:unnamed protein product [Mytilus edulis]|uniref:Uncharacterized protein n=1 Tax=Mytilus edulis TaxID=6550 RepID=A0A8S3VN79_MYTED|nr:unnamed protein product [Mytilus edulis]